MNLCELNYPYKETSFIYLSFFTVPDLHCLHGETLFYVQISYRVKTLSILNLNLTLLTLNKK